MTAVSAMMVAGARSVASAEPNVSGSEAPVADPIVRALAYTVTIEGEDVYGSGILIAPALGLVLTAQHVIDGVPVPQVRFYDGRSVTASLVAQDRELDIALLRVPCQPIPPPPIGDVTALRAGDELFAIGDPRRLAFSVSRGIVSYPGRRIQGARYLQTDLPINDGNSGGPVLTRDGSVVGIMSFILRGSQGLAFALPVAYALDRFAPYLRPDPGRIATVDRFRSWEDAASP